MEKETWKSLKGIVECGDNYSVSTLGNVRNDTTGKILSPGTTEKGYLHVVLQKDGKKKNCRLHRLVALAFIPNPDNKPEVNHKDGIKTHCRLNNLEWSTRPENVKHSYDVGLSYRKGEDSKHNKLSSLDVTKIKERLQDGHQVKTIAKDYGLDISTISAIKTGKNWAHIKVDGFEESNKNRPTNTKLSDKDVISIRRLYETGNYSYTDLARQYNVDPKSVSRIVQRKTWKHLP
ncbi:putative HNH homing endonuclease [Bacillus phage BCP8-2]|uniref:Putative HNH homing endonuclease n=1 Tax=Bacillus phage BCP8-2 TaxID=1129192 RepID=A0A0E3D9B7_9CAUD|nr:HNH endonuclease [Bacillus phage BCP8-2]AHJ87154.1 putative HNH homing endonuclease [Bacillus phage BCP8-2]